MLVNPDSGRDKQASHFAFFFFQLLVKIDDRLVLPGFLLYSSASIFNGQAQGRLAFHTLVMDLNPL